MLNVLEKPAGPHHFANFSGSLNASNIALGEAAISLDVVNIFNFVLLGINLVFRWLAQRCTAVLILLFYEMYLEIYYLQNFSNYSNLNSLFYYTHRVISTMCTARFAANLRVSPPSFPGAQAVLNQEKTRRFPNFQRRARC